MSVNQSSLGNNFWSEVKSFSPLVIHSSLLSSVFKHQFQASKQPWISSDNDVANFCPTVHRFWSGIFYFTFFYSLRCWNTIQMVLRNSMQLLWTQSLWCWTCHIVFFIGKDPYWMVWSNTHLCGRGLEYEGKYSKHISIV